MSSAATAPTAIAIPKQTFVRYTSSGTASPSNGSRSTSPHSPSCSSAEHSRSSSRRRESFGSIKEDVDGIAQSFVDTHIDQSPQETAKPNPFEMQPTPDFCCPCGGFLGWKQIRLGGKSLSRSYSDLRGLNQLHSRWAWESTSPVAEQPSQTLQVPEQQQVVVVEEKPKPVPGTSRLEKVPPEVLDQIISLLALDVPPNGYTPRNVDLISCLLTSRTLHAATLSVLYRNMTFPHSIIFSKALNHISRYPALGTLVRRLDFSHFTSVGLGRTKQMNSEIQNLTSKTLLQCLELLPNLRECLLQEHVEGDLSMEVIRKLFTGLPNLFAVDFCGCSTQSFSSLFLEALTAGPGLPAVLPNLKRVSLHECSSLPSVAFEILLPRLVNLTHLDLTHTQVSEDALFSIPKTAQITHLSLSRCSRLRGPRVVEFLTTHPAVCDSLVYLNLLTDPTRSRLLEEEDVSALLPHLPSTLCSLNLGGAKVTSVHTKALVPLTKHLEELGLSSCELSGQDLNQFFVPPRPATGAESAPPTPIDSLPPTPLEAVPPTPLAEWVPHTLRYLDLNKAPQLTIGTVFNPNACVILSQQTYPLQVIEFSDKLIAPLRERARNAKTSPGWTVRELGRRGWYVRDPSSMPNYALDDGSRDWKMGARWWGMRKIPVAVGEVGGIYGHYMFKK